MTTHEAKQRFTATLNAMNVAAFMCTITAEEYDTGAGVCRATNAAGAIITAQWHGDGFTTWDLIVPDIGKEGDE